MEYPSFAPIFTDHAVLQQEKPIKLWGSLPKSDAASPKYDSLQAVLTDLRGNPMANAACTKDSDHGFFAFLSAREKGGPFILLLKNEDQVFQRLEDIMIGEVWLAGGQSNMEYELQNDKDAKDIVPAPNVRFYQVLRQAFFDDDFYEKERNNFWMTNHDPNFGSWSAVGYHFAAELAEKLDCTVGIIGCNWGGTSASAWQSKNSLLSHPETAPYWDEYQKTLDAQTPEEYEKSRADYLAYQESWQPKINEFYAANPSGTWEEALSYAGPCLWPGPMGPKHEFRPAGLYETMLRRITPYPLRGVLYYQGESDDHRPHSYKILLSSLISQWRRDFEDDTLPFLLVQLPMHRYLGDAPSDSFAVIRKAQEQVWREDAHVGLAVAIDLGEYNNIHPTHKKEIGHRLFLQSMSIVYHILSPRESTCPMLSHAKYFDRDSVVRLFFDNLIGGFDLDKYQETLSLPADDGVNYKRFFEICDAKGTVFPADISFPDLKTIQLTVPRQASFPIEIRYLWINYSLVPLFDKRGLPLAPFCTKPLPNS